MKKGIVDRDIWDIGIWYNQNTKEYYYRLYERSFNEKVGFKNSYGHELLLIIKIYKDVVKPKNLPIWLKILKKFIRCLERLDNKFTRKYIFILNFVF